MHCPAGNATDSIWRVLASSNGISSWTPLKPQHSIPCWLSVQWEPRACRSRQCCQEKGIIKSLWVDLLCLAFLRASMLPLGTLSFGLWVTAVDPVSIAGHQSIKNCWIWTNLLDHLPAVMTTSFFLIFSEHPWDKPRANLPHLQFLANNCVSTVPTPNCALIVSIDTRRSLSMKFFIWRINSGVLTSLLLPHLSSSLTDSLPSLNLLCQSKTDARFMQDGQKAVRSIPYVSVAFFPSLKQNFIAYHSSKVSSPYLPTPFAPAGHFLSGVQQVWIQSFPSPTLVASPRLKSSVCPTIYP